MAQNVTTVMKTSSSQTYAAQSKNEKVYQRTSLNELHKTSDKKDIKNSLRNGYIIKMTTELLHNLTTQ